MSQKPAPKHDRAPNVGNFRQASPQNFEPDFPSGTGPTLADLKAECHGLIEAIARRSYNLKLLVVAKRSLTFCLQYKMGRTYKRKK